ncbi:DUF6115 domain-containing protein [Aquisalibacillus elongatus]|uniref:Coupling factor for flagellin transcription and translation n=1 Tax=Aquisalibacillus elongatus TaxID=485577 RepID=A0A3N5C1K9_9BACI|nr:hypothetical protein [Aquisalibacillus elongatus]RPF55968.1 hypothetical protein EDC24_0854 [Aquisalibacillus elongatus]
MNNILLIFSLILHGVTFVAIIWLYQQVQKQNESERHFEKRVRETEDMFDSYLLELKDENKKFIQAISKVEHSTFEPTKASDNQISQSYQPTHRHNATEQMKSDFKPESVSVEDQVEPPSLQTQVMHLYHSGHSIEEIAKKLDKGSTEIELIVKFNQKMHV